MNGSRMKYAVTPTYGMQKRSPLAKKNAFQQQGGSGPDFARATQQTAAMPNAGIFGMQPQQPQSNAFGNPYAAQPFAPGLPVYGPAGNGLQPGANNGAAAPYSSWQPGAPMMQPPPMGNGGFQPLGNATLPVSGSAFSPRNQGFVPPQSAAPVMQPAVERAAPGAGYPNPAPANAYPMMNMGGYAQPVGGYPGQTTMSFAPVQPAMTPAQAAPMQNGTPQELGGFPLSGPRQEQPRQPRNVDANVLWNLFLFAFLPLLFIPCIFVPQSWNFLRYAFIALSVTGLGAVWYRQMFPSSTHRAIVSVVYVSLCIVALSLAMQGGNDPRRTAGSVSVPAGAQQTLSPDASVAAAAELTPNPTPSPTPAGKPDVQIRLETFMNNWMGNQVDAMVSLVTPSWATKQESASSSLFQTVLNNRTPLSFNVEEVGGAEDDTSRTVTMTATIDKNNGKDPKTYRFTVLMVKEGGQWYVDPNSLASNDEVQTEDDVVVNDKSAASAQTAAPRMTVSPAPPGSTTLYYNANGGHYYHLDPNCESVNEENRPLPDSFPYSELASYNGGLNPCLRCGAPTSVLPDEDTGE